jgi:hypothetical protein
VREDIAKAAKFFNNDNGFASGLQTLQPGMLIDSMKENTTDRGLNKMGGLASSTTTPSGPRT